MIKIFFDDACSLCQKEIHYYKSISPKKKFQWLNIHENNALLKRFNISQNEALLSLHAIDEKQRIYKGMDAFSLIWRELKGWRWLSILVNIPLISPLCKILYKLFAYWRFNKLNYCKVQ